jgi:hypothetical protein
MKTVELFKASVDYLQQVTYIASHQSDLGVRPEHS